MQSYIDALRQQTTRVRLLKRPFGEACDTCLREVEGDRLDEVFALLRVEDAAHGSLMLSMSEYYLEFLPAGVRMMVDSGFARVEGWPGDVLLADPEGLLNWFIKETPP